MVSLFLSDIYAKGSILKPLLLAASILVGLNACTPVLVDKLPYYKLDVVQGVPFDPQPVLSIQPGMTRQQVALELGTPLLKSVFRENRWDYVYEIVRGGKIKQKTSLTVHFNGDVVSSVEGDALEAARQQMQGKEPAQSSLYTPQAASTPAQMQPETVLTPVQQ